MKKKQQHGIGALVSQEDNRRIALARVQVPVERPTKYYFDDSQIPTENQLQLGSCVGQAEGGEIECRELKDTGKVTPVSKRWIYAKCKKADGIPGQEGTYPTIMAKVKVEQGAVQKKYCEDDNTLSHEEYKNTGEDTKEIKDDASLRVASGYAFVRPVLEDVLQAIFINGTYGVTLECGDWGKVPVKPAPSRGQHRVRLNGYEEIKGDAKIWFRNSWGLKWVKVPKGMKLTKEEREKIARGDAFFLWSEYKDFIYEQIVFTDIPQALILEARSKVYIFERNLQFGMAGTDVLELQKRLAKEVAIDGLPCFRYPTATTQEYTTYFGEQTQRAVQRYQVVKKLASGGTPETTGYGMVGPKTRLSLNGKKELPKLYPKVDGLKKKLVEIMEIVGHPIVVTEEYRTPERQDELYAQGRTTPGQIVTNAKGGESFHNWRVAFDIAFKEGAQTSYTGPWAMVGGVGRALGLEWGGDWPSFEDKPHFQYTGGYTLEDFQEGRVDPASFEG